MEFSVPTGNRVFVPYKTHVDEFRDAVRRVVPDDTSQKRFFELAEEALQTECNCRKKNHTKEPQVDIMFTQCILRDKDDDSAHFGHAFLSSTPG